VWHRLKDGAAQKNLQAGLCQQPQAPHIAAPFFVLSGVMAPANRKN
jgi:hypothetical protein